LLFKNREIKMKARGAIYLRLKGTYNTFLQYQHTKSHNHRIHNPVFRHSYTAIPGGSLSPITMIQSNTDVLALALALSLAHMAEAAPVAQLIPGTTSWVLAGGSYGSSDGSPVTEAEMNDAAIAGAIIGALIGGILVLFCCFYCLKGCVQFIKDLRDDRRKWKREEERRKKAAAKRAATANATLP
jgi:hypothetical protein